MTEVMSNELIYASKVSTHSQPLYRKLAPQGVGTDITLSTSGTTLVEFVLPPSVMNLSKCRLNFDLAIPLTTSKYNIVDANTLTMLSRVVLYDSNTGNTLVDCSNFEKFATLVTPSATSYTEFKTKASAWTASGSAQALTSTTTTSQQYPVEDIQKSNSLVNVSPLNVAAAGTGGYNSFEGRRYLFFGASGAKSDLSCSIPFSAFKFTALALDRMCYSPSNLILQLYYSPTSNFAWTGASATDPTDTPTAVSSSTKINNVALELYTEGNLEVAKSVVDAVMSQGISIPIPYPTIIRQTLASGSFQSYNINLSSAYGKRILAIINSLFSINATSTLNAVNSHSSKVSSYRILTYNSFMNSVPILYNAGFDCRLGEDWKYGNRHLLEGSVIQNNQEYSNNEWQHIDSFMPPKPLWEVDVNQIDGYDVSSIASTYSVQYNLEDAAAAVGISCIIGQKICTFTNNGVVVN